MAKKKKSKPAPWLLTPELSMVRVPRTLDELEAFMVSRPTWQHVLETLRKARTVLETIPADVRPHAALFADLFCGVMWRFNEESADLRDLGAKIVREGERERLKHLHPDWDKELDKMPAGLSQGQIQKKLEAKLLQKIKRSTLQNHLQRRAEGRHLP
jgi:hypothetical protein